MAILNWVWQSYWNYLLEIPLVLFENLMGSPLPGIVALAIKVILSLVILYLVYAMVDRYRRKLRFRLQGDRDYDINDAQALAAYEAAKARGEEPEIVLPVGNVDSVIQPLKRAKDYAGMGKAYQSARQFKNAAKWFRKAGMYREAGEALASGGQTVQAAKLMLKAGAFDEAGRLFTEKRKHLQAARAYAQGGSQAAAAQAYVEAKRYPDAAQAYTDYFSAPRDDLERQVAAAEACWKLLDSAEAAPKIPEEQRAALLPALAERFERAKRYDHAASLYRKAGDPCRAGEVFVHAGKLQEAARCMKEAGRDKEAAQIIGRFKEGKGQWREAAMAYVRAGDVLHAGECYLKAGEVIRAAECFEKCQDHYRSGVAYARSGRFEDAVRVLQKIKDGDPAFDQARVLLGRCFYELHDYTHCAAALENHLMGKRVSSSNADVFYMLSLALEQLGRLDPARELLYKIRTVDVGFRDVTQRISNISSRISMESDIDGRMAAASSGTASAGGAPVPGAGIKSVEGSLGDRYRLERELGRGGMGVVYLARDTQLNRPVALKFLGSLVDGSEEYRQRFVREAQAAAKITHPNIISIYDISASVGKAYIAMEYIEGPSLHKYVAAKGALTPREAVNILGQACSALAAIHEVGIVHRDIKPDNILLAKGGLVKLMDFGLAKSEDSRMTRTGVVMGTPSYMAPEQVKGKEADARSDIYSVGLVLYECLSGETVFAKGDVLERQLEETPPPPSTVVEGVPPALDETVMKCIQKDPDKRFQTARELVVALRAAKG